jgi:hypothetical protein
VSREPAPTVTSVLLLVTLGLACDAGSRSLAVRSGAIVYGEDDRRDYFAVQDAAVRSRLAQSVVAIAPRRAFALANGRFESEVPSYGEKGNLCDGEPFADQPTVAFCSGILVDWDLVLTADHCTRVFTAEEMVVLGGYYYVHDGELAIRPTDVYPVSEIVAEALPSSDSAQLDFAWLRLSRRAGPPLHPAPIATGPQAAHKGDPLVFMGTPGGTPVKADEGGLVRDARDGIVDYFVADTDTFHGSSGGGAFDRKMTLVGILARGSEDLTATTAGCNASVREADPTRAAEEFTYAHRALEALCASPGRSSLCRADCGEPCEALPSRHSAGVRSRPPFCGAVDDRDTRRRHPGDASASNSAQPLVSRNRSNESAIGECDLLAAWRISSPRRRSS